MKAVMARSGALAVATLMVATACADTKSSTPAESDAPAEESTATTDTEGTWEFVSRPDLNPPLVDITGETPDAAKSLVFLAPKGTDDPMRGPVILDSDGEPVWVSPSGDRWIYDFRAQRYQGKPVLTYWRGNHFSGGYGRGEYVLLDQSYREIASVTTEGLGADFHNMTLTSRGTALMTSFPIVRRDLSDIGGPENGYVANCIVQEVDVKTGKVVFSWNMLEDVPLSESYTDPENNPSEPGTKESPLDPYHVNSVYEDGKNGLLVSARNTHAVYRIDKSTGKLDWTLNGKDSDFEMEGNSEFAWQHDAQRQPDGSITIFDNEAGPAVGEESRGLRLDVDEKSGTARVVDEYLPPDERLSASQGNMQVLPNGNVVIGWGSEEYYSEYAPGGKLLYDAAVNGQSYRVFRFPWHAKPTEPPKFVYTDGKAYVSWNGATEVAKWRFVAGADKASARPVATVMRDGFETTVEMVDRPYIAAQALDANGKVLATAEPGTWP